MYSRWTSEGCYDEVSRRLGLTPDARKQLPLAGETVLPTWTVNAPANLKPGQRYDLHLWLPDPSNRLASGSRYAIRLANNGVWDGNTGRNSLKVSVQVD